MVRAAFVLEARARPRYFALVFLGVLLLLPWPSRKCFALCFLILSMSSFVQRQCFPPFIPICSEGRTLPATIHLCSVIQ